MQENATRVNQKKRREKAWGRWQAISEKGNVLIQHYQYVLPHVFMYAQMTYAQGACERWRSALLLLTLFVSKTPVNRELISSHLPHGIRGMQEKVRRLTSHYPLSQHWKLDRGFWTTKNRCHMFIQHR